MNPDTQSTRLMKILIPVITLILICSSSRLVAAESAELDCLVKPEMYIELSSPVDTILEQMLVRPGDFVSKGQPLVQLEASVERARVRLAKLQSDSSNEIENREVQLKYARLNNKRMKDLYVKKSVSQYERDKSDTEVSLAMIELSNARDKKKIAQMNLELAQTQLALKTIKSPIDGIVVDHYATVGESVADRPIMKLAQIDPLKVELIAPSEYFGLIYAGMEVEILAERPANKTYKATVSVVDQLIDPASGSFTVRMALPNPGDELVGGVNCLASFDFTKPRPLSQNEYSEGLNPAAKVIE